MLFSKGLFSSHAASAGIVGVFGYSKRSSKIERSAGGINRRSPLPEPLIIFQRLFSERSGAISRTNKLRAEQLPPL